MEFKDMAVKAPFTLELDQNNTFRVESLKAYKNKFIAKGFWLGGKFPQRATLTGFCEKSIASCDKLQSIKDYVVDTEEPRVVNTYSEVAEILETNESIVFRLDKKGLFAPKQENGWNEYDLVRIKPFFTMNKHELLGELIRRELGL